MIITRSVDFNILCIVLLFIAIDNHMWNTSIILPNCFKYNQRLSLVIDTSIYN